MHKKIHRKDFLRTALLANAALITRPLQAFTGFVKTNSPLSNDNVTYYKKTDAPFELLRKGFNKRIEKYPLLIALCQNTEGVAEAMKYAIKNNLPVAIKSGGHCMEGFSCNDGGMVINLSLLNTIQHLDTDTIQLGPGCTLSKLYDELLPKKKIIPGGSCAGVAIGGLSLGGGYGLMSRKYGLTCDSLLEVTMVDGMGNIVSSANDKELLWACKGGGNGNFGVVTEMKFKTHTAPATMQSFRFKTKNVTAAKATEIFTQWFEKTKSLPDSCFSACLLNGKTVYILLTATEKLSTAVQEFIRSLSVATEKTTRTPAQPLARALKTYYGRPGPLNFKNASAGLYKNFEEIAPFIESVLQKVISTPGMIYQVNTLGGKIQDAEAATASSFPHRDNIYFSELQAYWESPKQGTLLMQRFQEIQAIFNNNGIVAQYRNYPDINFTNWQSGYYGVNYERLQAIKSKYDPNNFIRHEQSITGL